MAPIGGVVTQSLTQTSERGSKLNPHHHPDAAQIARIWMSMPARSDQQRAPLAAIREEPTEQEQGLAAGGPVKPAATGPTRARDRPSAAADQTQPAAQTTSTTCAANAAAPAVINALADPNECCYDQLQSPLFGKLPAELRLLVWEHALTPTPAIDRPTVAVALLESCRRAYDETKLMVYERNQVRAHLLQSPLPPGNNASRDQHWTRLLSPAQQQATHLNLYVQPSASNAWGWNLLRWTKLAAFAPHTLQLTLWFTSGGGWWAHHMADIFKTVAAMRHPGLRAFVLEFRTERDRFHEFDKRVQELRDRRIALADRETTLVWDGQPPAYFEGSRVMMDNAFGRPTRLPEDQQPRWVPCQDPEKDGEREMLATVIRWEAEASPSA